MSIGFSFTGRVKKPERLLSAAKELADQRGYQMSQWENGLGVQLCPIGGNLSIIWKKEGGFLGQWAVEGSCVSTPAGPGLHQAAVELLDSLDIQKLQVEDETEYYQHRDFQRMLREHFYPWLATLVRIADDEIQKGTASMCLCWDLDQYMPEDVPGTVITPMGRFSAQWLKTVLEEEGVEALAERFFLWYHPGAWDALFRRNLALNQLWEGCSFAPSSRSEEDAGMNRAICDNLEQAAELDPALPLPRQAYAEVCALAGRAPALPDGPELELEFQPGFRKGMVAYPIGPLRLTLPGIYLFEWEEWGENSGCHKWWNESSPIWRVSGYKMREGNAAFTPVLREDKDRKELEIKGGALCYGWRELPEEDGQPLYQVRGEVISGPSLFLITVTYQDPGQREEIGALFEKITVVTQDMEKHAIQANQDEED
ncbi:MAG: hypothetical protein HFF50_04840 [Lawsonibacter sp.]|nr:hypothetical protein [Lawsonibacter sp.]